MNHCLIPWRPRSSTIQYVLTACMAMLWISPQAQTTNAIFRGGSSDGHYKASYLQQSVSFWAGGSGDGHSAKNYVQASASFWRGGNGDGYATGNYAQTNSSFWRGGSGDGYTAGNYVQVSTSFWKGGVGDGYAALGYLQNSASFWKGGAGDGWASVYRPQGALPVTWLSFDAVKWQNTFSQLTWKTASEYNTSHFEIERGRDAVNFVKIATIIAAGTSSSPQTYMLNDSLPLGGLNYYRIRQVDKDGRFSYSPARLVRFDNSAQKIIRIYPNPARDFINIEIPEAMRNQQLIINLIAQNGAVVDHKQIPAGSNAFVRIDVSRLARAVYTVHIVSPSTGATTQIILQ